MPSARDGAARLAQQAPAAGSAELAAAAASDARVRTVPDAASTAIAATPARGFWVQLGAFRQRGGATAFQQRVAAELDWLSPLLAVVADASLFRLQAGPYPDRDQALGAAQTIRAALQLVPVIVERR